MELAEPLPFLSRLLVTLVDLAAALVVLMELVEECQISSLRLMRQIFMVMLVEALRMVHHLMQAGAGALAVPELLPAYLWLLVVVAALELQIRLQDHQ